MKKIPYYQLQKKYAGKMLALNKTETRVLAVAQRVDQILDKVKKQKIPVSDIVLMGPIQKYGTISVYLSLSIKANTGRNNR